jgi:hypothetical protein
MSSPVSRHLTLIYKYLYLFLILLCNKYDSLLAQLAERGTVNPEVVGSIPTWRVLFLSFLEYSFK